MIKLISYKLCLIKILVCLCIDGHLRGTVMECGSYEELIEKKGAFYRMEKM